MDSNLVVRDVQVATVQGQLPEPVIFGDWIINMREYAIVRVCLNSGIEGWSFSLTRDGAVAEQIRKTLAKIYVGNSVLDREKIFLTAKRRSLASHSSGIGLRALSLVDLAMWDAAAVAADKSIAELLGGQVHAMPATAIIGYPPARIGPKEIFEQTSALYQKGWRRFKAPVGANPEVSAERLRAARSAAPDAWLGCDAAWIYDNVPEALDFLNSIKDVDLGWFEDIFPPGDAHKVAELRRLTNVPIAMGDEQGGIYYPQALIDSDAVDVVRIDLTCMGGISGGKVLVDECVRRGIKFAPHMFAHVHSQVFSAWGYEDVPIEWGIPWTGVDPFADSLIQPVVIPGGLMEPLPRHPGFGELVNFDWIKTQPQSDPEGILAR